MSDSQVPVSLSLLLERLRQGDLAAAEQVFIHYEPYLRLLVRRQLSVQMRAKFDSVDIVQSVWADLLVGFENSGRKFADVDHLKAFLIKATRNRFIDRFRQHRQALAKERSLEGYVGQELPAAPVIEPGGHLLAEDLWQEMLTLCPPAHRNILDLKRQGCSLAEMAERTGLHPSSIRRILYDLARRLALKRKTPP